MASHIVSRPTPAPTSTITQKPALLDDSRLPRTEVYVMEKCCPHVSHFAVRDYPSAMEDDGWMPGLTFHAYKYQHWLTNCWQIINATESDASPTCSQRWQRIHGSATKTTDVTATAPSSSDSFCLPTENRLPDTRVSVFYVESGDARASFVTQPIRNASQLFFDTFTLSGWNDTSTNPEFHRVFPLAYYYWRKLMPMPRQLITDVRLHATEPNAPLTCERGYELVAGNFNYNFVGDPVAYFCVRYGYGAFVDPRFNLSAQPANDQTFLTDIVINAHTPDSLRNETPSMDRDIASKEGLPTAHKRSRLDTGDCHAPLETVASKFDSWGRHENSPERNAKLDALTTTVAQLNASATDYSVFTGNSEYLVFCMEKQPFVDASNGRYRSAASFVGRLYLDLRQIVRRQRLGVVYNVEAPVAAKQSPFGRIYYDVEDAKEDAMDARGHAFDEL